jgi:ABC-type nitrate/sulfonate/bicarbonate transport system substrate-binding protein
MNIARLYVLIFCELAVTAAAQQRVAEKVRVIAIPGIPLPLVIAKEQGILGQHSLEVQSEVAPNSESLRSALASGKADIAHAAVDNAVAMVETADVVIVMGGEDSLNELIAQPSIRSVAELRGKTVIVDAPNTGFALQLKKILLTNGLKPGRDYQIKPVGTTPQRLAAMREHEEYGASILGPPTSIIAKREGFVRLASTRDFVGTYQAGGAFVTRQWAHDHADALVRYLAAYIEAQRWLLAPANQQQATDLLMKQWHLSAPVAQEAYRLMKDQGWFEPDAGFDLDGFRNVLRLRAEIEGQWKGPPPAPEKYYDPSFYQKALAKLEAEQ